MLPVGVVRVVPRWAEHASVRVTCRLVRRRREGTVVRCRSAHGRSGARVARGSEGAVRDGAAVDRRAAMA